MLRHFVLFVACLLAFAPVASGQEGGEETLPAGSFSVEFDPSLQPQPYTGRVYVVLSKQGRGEPRAQMGNWFSPAQVFALDVKDLPAGGAVMIGPDALAFPGAWDAVASGEYTAQAVAQRSPDSPNPGRGPGDLFSKPVRVAFDRSQRSVLSLRLSETVQAEPFRETERIRLVEIDSPLLSAFHGRPMKTRAGVLLPKNWRDEPGTRHPTLYYIGGFGSDHRGVFGVQRMLANAGLPDDVMVVVPDPLCRLGHGVFADSENNGPRGESLMKELIPAVEGRFHGAGSGARRYVTGISSGGWACLWLQVTYPDEFAGCWSHCPDPVDFRDFQRINVYRPGENMYRDPAGARRPLARRAAAAGDSGPERIALHYDDFVRQETVLGPGGQIHSFEAVFSPRGPDGKPRPLFDRATGAIDSEVAASWEKYDIRLVVERGWPRIGPKLAGKLFVYAGEKDTFYLEGAARLLAESLKALGSDAQVSVIPGMPHTIHQPGVRAMFEKISKDRSN